jgi:prepilin peptidase CpaA
VISPPVVVVLAASLAAGIIDAWKFKIPNSLTLPLVLVGVVYHVVAGAVSQGWAGAGSGLTQSLLGALVGLALLIVFHLLGGMGAGDVKLLAGIGAWLGWEPTLDVFLASSVAAGIYALFLILFAGAFRHGAFGGGVEAVVLEPNRRKRLIPFGTMIAVGVIAWVVIRW